MILAVVWHAESVENADKYKGFYQDPRPWEGAAAHAPSVVLLPVFERKQSGVRGVGW
ncbi:hypothetical protein [Streptomyces sp. NPDC056632]|uniref:hypothetical protein n=1 Tax=Streptomyces sp. NPDC056632 TaxID=3345884 RepID=UPI0036A4F06F